MNNNINELISGCIEKMIADGYSEDCINRHRLLWDGKIVPYMATRGAGIFSNELGKEYLDSIRGSIPEESYFRHRRAIGILNVFMQTGNVPRRLAKLVEHPLEGDIGEAASRFLGSLREARIGERTIHRKRVLLSQFVTGLSLKGIHKVADMSTDDVVAAIDHCQECREERYTTLRQFCAFLHEEGRTPVDLGSILGKGNFPKREKLPSTYSVEEIARIEGSIERASAVGKRDWCVFLLAAKLGLRASDIAALTWDNLDWDGNRITLCQRKTGRPVELPLLREIGEALVTYARDARPKVSRDEVLLSARKPYVPMTGMSVNAVISGLIQSSGVKIGKRRFGPHSLRHSLASNMLRKGTPISVISSILGHGSTRVTMGYLRIDVESLGKCVLDAPLVDEAFFGQKGGAFHE